MTGLCPSSAGGEDEEGPPDSAPFGNVPAFRPGSRSYDGQLDASRFFNLSSEVDPVSEVPYAFFSHGEVPGYPIGYPIFFGASCFFVWRAARAQAGRTLTFML